MNSDGFARSARTAAYATAALSLGYAVAVAAGSRVADPVTMAAQVSEGRALNVAASWLLAALGLAATLPIVALAGRAEAGWARWGAGVGLIGASLTFVHGLYDAYRVPALLAQWNLGDPGRRAAIEALSGQPNPADPKGAASLLLMGLFVLATAHALTGPARRAGLAHGAGLVAAFAAGAVGASLKLGPVHAAYPWLAGMGFAVTGPLWWVAVGRLQK